MVRKAASILMSLLLTVPLWAASAPIGTIASSKGVTVSGNTAVPGSSLYSGDQLTVQSAGNASLLLNGGSRVVVGSGTVARVVRKDGTFALEVSRGGVAFSSSTKSLVEGRVADVTFRPKDPAKLSVAYISFKDSTHPVFFADKGAWLLTTAHDGHNLVLNPGEKVEGLVAPDNQGQTTPNPNNKKRKWAVFWIGGIVAGTATGLGLAFGQSECTSPTQGAGCVLSPVVPQL